jgi:L-aspartate oxidase
MDATGHEIERGLLAQIEANSNITVLENHLAVDLLIASRAGMNMSGPCLDRCLGAYVLDRDDHSITPYQAKVTMLCTGGTGKVYLYTTNPDIATGDGIAMAYRAGARVANLEFVQFHPTCLFHPKTKNFLISEAVRGEGGILVNEKGEAFMHKYDPRADLATRDTVARAIDTEMKNSGDDSVFLDISHKDADFIRTRFPMISSTCLALGIDITREPIPVVPAAHYMCGGVVTDIMGRTNIANLYALGETGCTGLHGGNRLASNSLLEAVVLSHNAARQCKQDWAEISEMSFPAIPEWTVSGARKLEECVLISHCWDQIRRLMWNYVGIVRSEHRLALVRKQLAPLVGDVNNFFHEYLLTPNLIELRNIALIADLIVRSALSRKESRGLHFMLDYPEPDEKWAKNTVL